MRNAFSPAKRVFATLVGLVMAAVGAVWILQGLDLAFRAGFMVGNRHWTLNGAILALVGIALVIWSNTRRLKS